MAMTSSEVKKVAMRCSDGVVLEAEESVAKQCQSINFMIEDNCSSGVIPIPNVDSETLSKVLEYCKKHHHEVHDHNEKEELNSWDQDFIDISMKKLIYIFTAANCLSIDGLVDLCAQKAADTIKGKMPDEIREAFDIENDLTPDEEEKIRSQNSWVFEPVEKHLF